MALLVAALSALLPVLLKLALDWLEKQGAANTVEAETQAVINAPRSQSALVDSLKKGTF